MNDNVSCFKLNLIVVMSLFLLASSRRKTNEKEEEQEPDGYRYYSNFQFSTVGVPSLLPELMS
ncbi:hypothetical protein [Sulfurimonas sp. HSL3-7]|uniref:hypothetical protein n=1 Tax=Sulfonitrofixus jiaomeiensis TaxID=3131938 RepID=UPI0031F7A4BD